MTDCDVAIVGYGPVGQALAGHLGKLGHKVMAFERHPSLYGRARAGHIDGEIMRGFQALGVAHELELIMRPISSYELISAKGEVLKTVQIGKAGTGWKPSYLFHQPELEQVLDSNVRKYSNVTVSFGAAVTGLEIQDKGVELTYAVSQSESSTLQDVRNVTARFVVGCDGANSLVRDQLGVSSIDLGFEPYQFLVLDFKHLNPDRSIPSMGEVRQILDPKRPTTAGRWNGNSWSRWEFMKMPGESKELMETDEFCFQLLAPWGVTSSDGSIDRRTVYTFQSRVAERWRSGAILLAGDAAHTMPPFMAQGLCSGLRDVVNLTWKLDAVLRDTASDHLLDTYEEERKPHVTEITEMAIEVGRLVTVTDAAAARARDEELRKQHEEPAHGLPPLRKGLFSDLKRDKTLSLAGTLSPQGRVHIDGRTGLLDDIAGSGWRVVSRHPLPPATVSTFHRLIESIGCKLIHVTRGCIEGSFLDLDATYSDWFALHGVEAYVERPDFHIFGAAETMSDVSKLLESLKRALVAANVRVEIPARETARA